jgi:phosphoglycerol transferase
VRAAGTLNLAAILVGTIAGLSGIFATAGVTYIRTWSRISIFIAFFSLVAVAHLADAVAAWIVRTITAPRAPAYVATAAVSVFLLATLDQTAPSFTPTYRENHSSWYAETRYFHAVQQALGKGTPVFQLPYVDFPEGTATGAAGPYDGLAGYFHSDLRWSYGGVRGESADWQPEAMRVGLDAAIPRLWAVGFKAVMVDRLAYPDAGLGVEAVLRRRSPRGPIADETGRWATYILNPTAPAGAPTNSEVSRDVLDPVRVVPAPNFVALPPSTSMSWRLTDSHSAFSLVSLRSQPRQTRLRGTITLDRPGIVSIKTVQGAVGVEVLTPTKVRIDAPLLVSPGETAIEIDVRATVSPSGPRPVQVTTQWDDVHVDDESLIAALGPRSSA